MAEIEKIKQVLGTLIMWMAQSSVSPISVNEAGELLKMLNEEQVKQPPTETQEQFGERSER